MKVNDEEHSTTITEMSSKDAIFEYPGKDHYDYQLLKPAIYNTTYHFALLSMSMIKI